MKYDPVLQALLVPMTVIAAPVYAVDYLTVEEAQEQLFPQANHFIDSALVLTKDQRTAIKHRAGTRQRAEKQRLWRAVHDDESLGWMFVDNVIGKHEFITYAAGINRLGEITGVEIMSYRETRGGEVRDAAWRNEFKGKSLKDAFRLGKDVPNISGATLSCRNITDGVKRLLVIWEMLLKENK